MKFIIGESFIDWMNWASYRGAIGLFFDTTAGGVLAYVIFGLVCLFAIIGFLVTLKWIFIGGKKKPKEPKPSSLERDVRKIDREVKELQRHINQK